MREIMPKENIFFITNNENLYNVFNQIKEIEKEYSREQILIEPASLNTAPAVTYSIKHLIDKVKIDPREPIFFPAADHYIGDKEKYVATLNLAAAEVGDNIGAIGIKPTRPETGYGYILKGEKEAGHFKVLEYKEKPNKETAEKYLEDGRYLWNAAMYVFNAKTFSEELQKYSPEIFSVFSKDLSSFLEEFKNISPISIDYAISEKSERVIVFEGEFGWNDIGSFDSLAELKLKDKNPNHLNFDSKNVFVLSEAEKLVATIGVEDINIIETADSILVQKRGKAEDVKKVVEYLKEHKLKELDHNLLSYRPWGKYEVLFDGPAFKVKKFVVYPGAKLSLQSHKYRSEHWVVVRGSARITRNDEQIILKEGESTFVPQGVIHRFENPTDKNAEFVEVQLGSYLGEDDIVRYEDNYGRPSGSSGA